MAQSKRWCFTLHAGDEEQGGDPHLVAEFLTLDAPTWGLYGGAQLERAPDTNRLHVQGFCVFAGNKRLAALKKLHPRAHWEVMKGTLEQSEAYCSKEESRAVGYNPRTWGERPVLQQGKRNDLAHAVEALNASKGDTIADKLRDVAAAEPAAYVKYYKGLEALAKALKPKMSYSILEPRRWQKELIYTLNQPADDRTILWFTDYAGGAGKSTVVKHCVTRGGTTLTGRLADMAYAYNGEPVVFFDVTRTQAEHMDHLYQFAEQLKNGIVFSSKYESGTKCFDPPHVVFFANQGPHPGKWSDDRCIHKELNASDKQVVGWDPLPAAQELPLPDMENAQEY